MGESSGDSAGYGFPMTADAGPGNESLRVRKVILRPGRRNQGNVTVRRESRQVQRWVREVAHQERPGAGIEVGKGVNDVRILARVAVGANAAAAAFQLGAAGLISAHRIYGQVGNADGNLGAG